MKTITMHRILILACICFHIGDLNAVPADYEAIYTVKLLQADGTLKAKLENNDGIYTYTLKQNPPASGNSLQRDRSMSQVNLRSLMKK